MSDQPDPPPGIYNEGVDSFNQGWPREDCPYPPDSDERSEWLRGWDDAAQGGDAFEVPDDAT